MGPLNVMALDTQQDNSTVTPLVYFIKIDTNYSLEIIRG